MNQKEVDRLKAEQPDHKHAFEMKEGGYVKTMEMKYRKAAYKRHHDSGRVEVDLSGEVSVEVGGPRGEVGHGAYVQAWVCVSADDLEDGGEE